MADYCGSAQDDIGDWGYCSSLGSSEGLKARETLLMQ